jgi:hypothetical protein
LKILLKNYCIFSTVTFTVTGLDFTFSKERVLLGSTGTLTMTCDVTEANIEIIYLIQIRRLKSTTSSGLNSDDWHTLAETSGTPTLTQDIEAVASKDYVAGGSWDSTTPANTYLTLSMNMEKLVCDDARYYRCEMSFKITTAEGGGVLVPIKNATFSAYGMFFIFETGWKQFYWFDKTLFE